MVCTLTHTETLRHVFFYRTAPAQNTQQKNVPQQDAATTLCAETH